MPIDKKPFERLLRMNEIFNTRKGGRSVVTSKELMSYLGISMRQLRIDIKALKNKGAPLEYDPVLRGYRYSEPFGISDNIPLSPQDILHLRIAVETLSKVNNLEGFQQLPEIFEKIRSSVDKWVDRQASEKAIYFDPLPRYEGSRHLAFLLRAVEHCYRIKFDYFPFHALESKSIIFDPYFLRHYDRRWYVGGFSHDPDEQFVRTFPLERISGNPNKVGYFHNKPKNYNPETYWKNIYGITIPPSSEIEEVVLSFSSIQGKYFLTSPFFEPFEIIENTNSKLMVLMRLIPNIDLIRKLAGLGADVRVIRPEKLADELREFHRKAFEKSHDRDEMKQDY